MTNAFADIDKELLECEHDDVDEGMCLDCGKCFREELSAQAYDRYKDFKKYGDT